jgi:hypothetical protein
MHPDGLSALPSPHPAQNEDPRMNHRYEPPEKISELIDMLDRVREELLTIQRSMEKLEKREPSARPADIQVTGNGNDGVE